MLEGDECSAEEVRKSELRVRESGEVLLNLDLLVAQQLDLVGRVVL
jgi:hypothetical protein